MLTLAAQQADIVGLGMQLSSGTIGPAAGQSLTAEATEQKLAWIREGAGSRWPRLALNARVTMVSVASNAVTAAEDLDAQQ